MGGTARAKGSTAQRVPLLHKLIATQLETLLPLLFAKDTTRAKKLSVELGEDGVELLYLLERDVMRLAQINFQERSIDLGARES